METRKATVDEIHRLRLVGAEVEVSAGAAIAVGPTGVLVGSGSDCDLEVDDPLVSRRHVELRAEEAGVRLIDLGSTNGTRLGTVLLRDALFTTDAVLGLGDSSLSLRLAADPLDLVISPRERFGGAIAKKHRAAPRLRPAREGGPERGDGAPRRRQRHRKPSAIRPAPR